MTPSPQQLLEEGNAVRNYLQCYRLSQKDFIALLWKRKEVTLEEAEQMVAKYIERYPAVKQYFLKS